MHHNNSSNDLIIDLEYNLNVFANKESLFNELNNINLHELSEFINSKEYKNYFLSQPGQEHYKLLAYFSSKFNNASIIDIGTLKGCSALALSYNKTNHVTTFNIEDHFDLASKPNNITFIVDNILKQDYKDLILSSKFILLDTNHDGAFEKEFHTYLQKLNWKGILVLDDTKLNNEMINYWNNITENKIDITEYGHCTGTGLVIFS